MSSRKLFGVLIIIFGALLLLDNAGIADVDLGELISTFWPMVLIIIGAYIVLTNPASKVGGLITLAIGVVFQLKTLGYFDVFKYLAFWPVVLILIGLWIVLGRGPKGDNFDSNDSVNAIAVFSGSTIRNISQQFQGGSITALFGGVKIDLRDAEITQEQKEARIEVFTAFGGAEILVPLGWNVVIKGIPLFGGWENKAGNRAGYDPDQDAPVLKLNCLVLFGGLEVKN